MTSFQGDCWTLCSAVKAILGSERVHTTHSRRRAMAELSKKLTNVKSIKANKLAPSFGNMTSLTSIETEYIRNLQKQVYLLELETSFLYPFMYKL
ncbi:hypothetical protein NDU88_002064 [Pleurodeles waltl]|uniref:Uncharacterized protein n=1 Tax=Pleurodeles waltl TaxID=8319 RepID=A0AAV7UXN5_PLEWA|nr:hypothetical protein NDU88_002064 [Pleurodeles waltl]